MVIKVSEQSMTYELHLRFEGAALSSGISSHAQAVRLKAQVISWLQERAWPFADAFIDGVEDEADQDPQQLLAGLNDAAPVTVYAETDAQLQEFHRLIQAAFADQSKNLVISEKAIPQIAWQQCWEDSVPAFATRRFFVGPSQVFEDETLVRDKHLMPIVIDAVEAFGTGQHATTKACIEVLERLPFIESGRCLDLGTGTGILGIAAAKCGYGEVIGTDIDAGILNEATRNVTMNQVTMELLLTDQVPLDRGSFDLITANILVPVLHDLLPAMSQCLKPGGYMMLAGFIEKDLELLQGRAHSVGLVLDGRHDVRGWLCLTLRPALRSE